MVKNTKAKGSRRERQCMKILVDNGYTSVTKSGASLGLWDVIGHDPDIGWIVVQCKSNRMPPRGEMKDLIKWKAHKSTSKELWIFIDHKGIKRYVLSNSPENPFLREVHYLNPKCVVLHETI